MKNLNISKQKGVSLYLAIMIMVILLAIVLGISAILIGQARMVKGMGDSVIALYAADTGIEKVLSDYKAYGGNLVPGTYYGALNIDNDSYSGLTGAGVCPENLQDKDDDACYKVKVESGCGYTYCIKSVGVYKETRRAIEVDLP